MYADTVEAAKREATGFVNLIKSKCPFSMPVALDIEEAAQYNMPGLRDDIIKAFISVVEAAGYYCMLYSYEAFSPPKCRQLSEVAMQYGVRISPEPRQ